jgi:hypothetical protein
VFLRGPEERVISVGVFSGCFLSVAMSVEYATWLNFRRIWTGVRLGLTWLSGLEYYFYWFPKLHGVIVKILRYCALRVVQYTVL